MDTLFMIIGGFCGILALIKVKSLRRRIGDLEEQLHSLEKRSAKPVETVEMERKVRIPKPISPVPAKPFTTVTVTDAVAQSQKEIQPATIPMETKPVILVSKTEPTIPIQPSVFPEPVLEQIELGQPPQITPVMETGSVPKVEEKPIPKVPKPDVEMDLETRIGAVWFNRIGLVVLIIGFALMGRYITPHLQPWHKTLIAYLSSTILFILGKIYEKPLKQFARPVIAGALALAFFTSYAAHFLPAMACVPISLSLLLMSLSVGGIFLCAERWKSESTALLAIFLGHVSAFTAGGDADSFSLVAILFLSISALFLLWRHQWASLSIFSVCAAYISHSLWAMQDHPVTTPEFSFWINFIFLSSYYTIFLFADLIYQSQRQKPGMKAFTLVQRISGRSIGPTSLILYASLTSGMFYGTKIFWDRIFLFLIPLAFVQMVLLLYHQTRKNLDHPFYAATGVIFVTLGLFSWIGGLSLNMALAAQALLLLVLSRWMRFWFLNPLAQAVLAINFIHFWASNVHHPTTWPSYWGCLATSLVYFVKSRLEETWRIAAADEIPIAAKWINALRDFIQKANTPLSYLHAVVGAFLMVYSSATFLYPPYPLIAVDLAAAAAAGFILLRVSHPLIPAVWLFQFALFTLLPQRQPSIHNQVVLYFPTNYLWILKYGIVISVPMIAGAVIYYSQIRKQPVFSLLGLGSLALGSLMALFVFKPTGTHPVGMYLLSAVSPALFWLMIPLWEKSRGIENWQWSAGIWGRIEKLALKKISVVSTLIAITAALLINRVFLGISPTWIQAFWILSGFTCLFLAYAVFLEIPALTVGLIAHLFILSESYLLCVNGNEISNADLLSCCIVGCNVLTAVGLIFSAIWKKRTSFAWGCMVAQWLDLFSIFVLFTTKTTPFVYYALWITLIILLAAISEIMSFVFSAKKITLETWRETIGINALIRCSSPLGKLVAILSAGLIIGITYRHFDSIASVCWVCAIFGMTAVLISTWLQSTALVCASIVFFTAAHYLFYTQIHMIPGAVSYPILTGCLIGFSLLYGIISEWDYAVRKDKKTPLQRTGLIIGAFYMYFLAYQLGLRFLEIRRPMGWGIPAMIFPTEMLLVFLLFVLGWGCRFHWMQIASYLFTFFWIFPYSIGTVFFDPGYHRLLVVAGIFIFLQLILMERILFYQKWIWWPQFQEPSQTILRQILIIGSGAMMIIASTYSAEIQGYWTTVGWSLPALVLIILGFLWKERTYRRTALVIFALAISRVMLVDVAQLEAFYRMAAFLCLGVCLIAVSFLYSRFRKTIQQWL